MEKKGKTGLFSLLALSYDQMQNMTLSYEARSKIDQL